MNFHMKENLYFKPENDFPSYGNFFEAKTN